MNLECELPYRCVNIDRYGNVYPCCIEYCRNFSFGNILEEPFCEIWNGEKAKEFRRQFVNNDYKYCNKNICLPHRSSDNSVEIKETADRRPTSVLLGYDETCNVKCIFCNHEFKTYPKKFENIENWYLDLFKDVQQINVSCNGEALASSHSRMLIKKIADSFPNINFDILTNGLLFNDKNIKELNIENRLSNVGISFHSLKKRTYNKMVKYSNFHQVMKNVKYAIELKKQDKIKNLEFRFVITSYNYKEMIKFAKYAKRNNARCIFMDCMQYNTNTSLYKILNVTTPKHPDYNKFIKLVKHPIFKEDFVSINKSLFDLKPVSFYTSIKNKLISALSHYSSRCSIFL